VLAVDASDAEALVPPPCSEVALVAAIPHQALLDLKHNAPEYERALSVAFFANDGHHLQRLCDLVGLDHRRVQRLVARQSPVSG